MALIAQQVAIKERLEGPTFLTVVAVVASASDAREVEAAVMLDLRQTRPNLTRDRVTFVGSTLTITAS